MWKVGTRNIPFDLLVRAGKIEKYVRKGRAQACIDITSSGKSMKNNGIEPFSVVSAIRARGIIGTPQQQIFPNRDDRVIIEMMERIYD